MQKTITGPRREGDLIDIQFSAGFRCSQLVLGVLGWFWVFLASFGCSLPVLGVLIGFGCSWPVLNIPGQS